MIFSEGYRKEVTPKEKEILRVKNTNKLAKLELITRIFAFVSIPLIFGSVAIVYVMTNKSIIDKKIDILKRFLLMLPACFYFIFLLSQNENCQYYCNNDDNQPCDSPPEFQLRRSNWMSASSARIVVRDLSSPSVVFCCRIVVALKIHTFHHFLRKMTGHFFVLK